MFIKSIELNPVTNASGDATAVTEATNGRFLGLIYVPDGTVPFTNAHSVTVTALKNGQALLTLASVSAAFSKYPKVQNSLVGDGTAITGVYDFVPLPGMTEIQIVIAGGGNTKTGKYYILVG